jgi:prepilin signal peptidase PulO-like enzyme (type II secretory pathway)
MYIAITVCFCLGIAIFDLKTCRIPDILLIAFAFLIIVFDGSQPFAVAAARLVTALAVLLLFAAVWYFSRGMGLGDVKYAAVLGYILGPDRIIHALLFTAFLSIVIYVMGIFLFHWSKTVKIPFAPFLSAGAITAVTGGMI